MIKKTVSLRLPEGKFKADVEEFEESDWAFFIKLYNDWRSLCDYIKEFSENTRAVNTPELLSEGVFCLEMGYLRVSGNIRGAKSSFDCYNPKNRKRVQLKACGTEDDLTSFGPKSVWDEIYFVDFYRCGKWDGKFDIYLLNDEDIYSQNVSSQQKFTDQQKEKRRPRFRVKKKLIQKKGIKPLKTASLYK